MNMRHSSQHGHVLITLLVFMVMSIAITGAAVTVTIINTQAESQYANGAIAFANAETGVENARLRLLRDPDYTGEILTLEQGTATITVSGTTTKTIISEGSFGDSIRRIQAIADLSGGTLTVTDWSEQP